MHHESGDEAECHERHCKDLTDAGRGFRRLLQVACAMPYIRAQHSPAVKRESWNQIKGGQQEVNVIEVADHFHHHPIERVSYEVCDREKNEAQSKARERAGNGRQEFGFRSARVGLSHFRNTTEYEKRNLTNSNSQPPRDKAVAKFMQQHARKKA